MSFLDHVRWNADGLAPAIAQDGQSGRVLTLAWMNRSALSATTSTGFAHYWSRSRRKLWKKGEASGHVQAVREIRLDCDSDAILLLVDQRGGIACHTGRDRCFYKRLDDGRWESVEPVLKDPKAIYESPDPEVGDRRADSPETVEASEVLATLASTIESRKGADAGTSYVASLLAGGEDALLKKIGEEATETMLAAKDQDRGHLVAEVADLWFHCLVLLARHGAGPDDVLAELARRQGRSGLEEKASRTK
jgi:phosphoribosyl-ATP pyrophosphohydrolase/phosphoribosyl-AMP cyclohydrolase